MTPDEYIQEIINYIENAIADFQKKIPGIQQNVFDELQNLVSKLETKSNSITSSATNLKLIGNIKNKIQGIITDSDYLESSVKFISAFSKVEQLQNSLFAAFNAKFKPSNTLGIIKQLAVESTANALLDQGLQANIIDKVADILRQNITAGVSVAQLNNQLRDHVLTNQTGLGNLERYTTQITTDALNQYSAQYNDAVAQDLGIMNWGRYVGSNIKTTREFCEHLSKKQWVHRTELAAIIQGSIDGHQCHLNKKTGLPDGMIAGTNTNNFNIYRGGYNCGHQFFWIPDAAVPDQIKNNIGNPQQQQQKYDIKILKKSIYGDFFDSPSVIKKLAKVHPELSKEEKVAVYGYSGNEYFALNKFLRGNGGVSNIEYQKNYKELLNQALENIKTKYEGWVFRGTSMPQSELKKYYDAYNNNSAIEHKFFTSTSKSIGESFGGTVKMSILSKTGKFIGDLSAHGSEQEILFKSNTLFRIISIREEQGVTYIKMQEA